jgi:DNA ligase (NAD+)
MDIEGLSDKTIKRLLESSVIRSAADLYTVNVYDLIDEGLGSTRAPNLIKAIQESKKVPFGRVLYAIGISHVGLENAQMLADHFGNIDNIMNASVQDLQSIDSVGDVIAKSVVDFFRDPDNVEMINIMRKAGVQFSMNSNAKPEKAAKATGKVFGK